MMRQILIIKYWTLTPYSANFSVPLFLRFAQIMYPLHTLCSKTNHPIMKKEEPPQVLLRSQTSQVSATQSLYFILLNLILPVKQFLQFSNSICRCHLSYTIILQWEWVFSLHPDHWNRFKVSVPTLYTSFIF